MDSITIISKEIITKPISWPTITIGALAIATLIGILIYFKITKNAHKTIKWLVIYGFGGICLMFISLLICSIFFRVPTTRYKYEGTIDKDKMSVSEYEEFTNQYNFRQTMKKGVYYWEDPIE